ncbi:MAG: alpha/beta hydrolase [Alphaproteobacteria bacterium]|nr:alpha/beta hydrolase [Alphaproteobacteria bacterium]MBL6938849.1 alpha/beta hydrolase [Alphaproteobacteria bacterium]MBL7099441.1 alpha/beta hydrolase [Alphaproteobacteria bacterium]
MRHVLIILGIILAVLVGLFFYMSAPDIPRATLEAKYATPPSQFVELTYPPKQPLQAAESSVPFHYAARAHYRVRGDANAPTILLLHGSNASLFTWEPWSKTLSDEFRVISVDLPAHGLTGPTNNQDYTNQGMVNFVKAFADKLGLKTFTLGGNSMGGAVAARFAEQYPDRVDHLILVDAAGMPSKEGDQIPLAFRLLRMGWAQTLLAHLDPKPLVKEGLDKAIVQKKVLTDQMVQLYTDMALLEGERQATFERFNEPYDRDSIKKDIGKLTMPVLILWGEQDHLIPAATAATWKDGIPGSKVIIYAGVGHIPMEEVPNQSARDVREFLTGKKARQ